MARMGTLVGTLCSASWGTLAATMSALHVGLIGSWLWILPAIVLAASTTTAVLIVAALRPALAVWDAGRERGRWEALPAFWRH